MIDDGFHVFLPRDARVYRLGAAETFFVITIAEQDQWKIVNSGMEGRDAAKERLRRATSEIQSPVRPLYPKLM